MTAIDKAIEWALAIANDNSHGYDQGSRWGPDYDCSSLLIQAWENAGVPVKSNGATYTGNMYDVFIACGFEDVTNKITLSTGKGLEKGDVLLNVSSHTEMSIGDGQIVGAHINELGGTTGGATGDQTENEISTRSYYNYPWDYVLRYPGGATLPEISKADTYSKNGYLTREQMKVNAQYIAQELLKKGWSLNAIAGVLGNMETESTINPGIWENLDDTQPETLGRGLVGWTPAIRVNNWAAERGLNPADIDTQIAMLAWEVNNGDVYYKTSSYPTPETFAAFTVSMQSPEYLAMAFLYNYERPYSLDQPNRATQARYWYDYLITLSGQQGSEKKRKGLSLLLMWAAIRGRS